MLKSYEELRKVDVRPYCDPRDGFLYLNWAKCIELLHDNGAEKVYFEPIPDEKTGSSLRMTDAEFKDSKGNTNRCYETRIKVVIDDLEFEMQTPVMNGSNPVKDNSMSQQRVWTSMCRAFVKGVAIRTGLGFSLWLDEEEKATNTKGKFENEIPVNDVPVTAPMIKCLEHYAEEYHLNLNKWLESNGTDWEHLTDMQAGLMLRALNEKYGALGIPEEQEVEKVKGKKK